MTVKQQAFPFPSAEGLCAAGSPLLRMLCFLKTLSKKKTPPLSSVDYREIQDAIQRSIYYESLFQSNFPNIR